MALHNCMIYVVILTGLALLKPGLGQDSPTNLAMEIRNQINSALSSLTCTINNSSPPPTAEPTASSTTAYDNTTLNVVVAKLDNISNRIDALEQKVIALHQLGSSPVHPASSCAEILQEYPESSSGYYWVGSTTGHAHSVYCDMTRTCGGVTGGWMRVAYLDMTNTSHQCPSSLHQRTDSNVRSCAVASYGASCSIVWYESHDIQYYQVCGKVHGYRFNTLDGFYARSTGLVLHMVGAAESTFGHLLPVAPALVEMYQHLLVITISVIHDNLELSTYTTRCGMERGVAATPAVPTTTLPGSTDSSHTLPLRISR